MGYKSGIQLLVATLLVFLIKYTQALGHDNHNGNLAEILNFWEPDPKYDTTSAASRRRFKPVKQNQKFQYGSRNEEPDARFDTAVNRRRQKFINENEQFQYRRSNETSKSNLVLVQQEGSDQPPADVTPEIPDTTTPEIITTVITTPEITTPEVTTVPDPQATTKVQEPETQMIPEAQVLPEVKKEPEAELENKPGGDEIMNEDVFILSTYEIVDQFNKIFKDMPELNTSSEVLGRTASYNDIVLFKISKIIPQNTSYFRADDNKYIEEVPEKKIIFIVHALSSMGLKYLYSLTVEKHLRMLLSFYFAHLDHFDIFLLPMANPDGYVQSKMSDFWNKNVSPQPACAGVAVDRNFDVAWNLSRKVSSCSQQYPGEYPFSEPESVAVKSIFHQFSHRIIAYFHVHAATYNPRTFKSVVILRNLLSQKPTTFAGDNVIQTENNCWLQLGDAVLYPRGFAESQSDDDKYIDLRGEIDEGLKNASFKTLSVTVDTLLNWYGKVAGTSVDYAATVYGIPYAMELVMQVYNNPNNDKLLGSEDEIRFHALKEIWGRLINIIFTNIWKKNNAVTEAQR